MRFFASSFLRNDGAKESEGRSTVYVWVVNFMSFDLLHSVWYDRLALVLMQHLSRPEEAMRIVIDALHDELTHIGELWCV